MQASSFVGRERELDELGVMLASSRLLTLTGLGGCGKTRLALQTAANLAEDFEGGAGFIELASLTDPELVAEGAARAFGLRPVGLSPDEALLNYLEPRATLLLLDNCEHVIEGCAGLADVLLRTCPGLKILATSREALRVPGERTWLVPSLSLPEVREEMDPGQLARHESVRLFVERAKAAAPPFGIAWYEGDIETNVQGYGKGFFVGRFNRETFAMDPDSGNAPIHHSDGPYPDASTNPDFAPIHTHHLGLFFDSPGAARRAGCPADVTLFNG
jgi:hypothetical protein